MSPIPRASALKLASTAHDLGADAVRGTLAKDQAGHWCIGHTELDSWLSRFAGRELVLAAAAIDEEIPTQPRRTCRTCGNEYDGPVCPHCEAIRRRLRGG